MEKTVLTADELQSLKNLQTTKNQLMNDLGYLEFQKQEISNQKTQLIEVFNNLKSAETKLSKELQEKYGDGNINLGTGEFISVT